MKFLPAVPLESVVSIVGLLSGPLEALATGDGVGSGNEIVTGMLTGPITGALSVPVLEETGDVLGAGETVLGSGFFGDSLTVKGDSDADGEGDTRSLSNGPSTSTTPPGEESSGIPSSGVY
jgi:hypothetical protein